MFTLWTLQMFSWYAAWKWTHKTATFSQKSNRQCVKLEDTGSKWYQRNVTRRGCRTHVQTRLTNGACTVQGASKCPYWPSHNRRHSSRTKLALAFQNKCRQTHTDLTIISHKCGCPLTFFHCLFQKMTNGDKQCRFVQVYCFPVANSINDTSEWQR